ncbi:putative 4E-interacting protein [Trypanosoma rangeli]|uniref:Putative 4E-interacting protein n=1 Tax=Trypanosoma rangeli TaxID=5698 RepID=A0A422MY64_TRYRA|nr:putative 4E-interacting protein [Trypanosoma rangeli]RNE98175.1 putative 4E-interacting protein [Trypanosoma rangeli]|eukprot:RNE98175.1 putative 4E-interacting protein [Trypanosoma rangeli]
MSSRIRYTRAELLAVASKQHEYNLTVEALRKFKVIETESPVKEKSIPESHRNEAGGRKADAKNGVGSRRAANNERFALPSRGARGNKDQEAFEEGYKYELERNAIKKQTLQETMEKEKEKIDAVAAAKGEGETKQQLVPAADKEASNHDEDEEVERWMTSIAMGDDGAKRVTKSRFFSGADAGNKSTSASALPAGPEFNEPASLAMPPSAKDPWSMQGMMHTSGNAVWGTMETQRNSGLALAQGANTATAPSVVVGPSVHLPAHSGISPPSSVHVVAAGASSSSSAATTVPLATVPSSTSQKTTTTGAAPQPSNSSMNPATQVWNAEDLEQMLLSAQNVSKQSKPEVPKPKVIDAASLESQLRLQVQQNMVVSKQHTQTHVQQQPQPLPLPQLSTMDGTPPALSLSGAHKPPQLSLTQPPQQLPPQQQHVLAPWGATMSKVPPQPMHQKLMQQQSQHRHPGMTQPVPFIISGGQGAPYFPQQAMHGQYVTGFLPGQGQQPMMVYRSPDGTAQYAVGTTGYPPNAQLLFSPLQQQQPQRR